jgi:hypothetical protein
MWQQVARSRLLWVILGQAMLVAVLITSIVTANSAWWLWLLVAVGLAGLAAAERELNRARRRVQLLRADVGRLVDRVISEVLKDLNSTADSAKAEREIRRRLAAETQAEYVSRRHWPQASSLISPEEVHRRLRLRLQATVHEEIRSEAVMDLLPSPRTAKRLVNRLHFLIVVAWSRNLIGDVVSPEQLGKWAVLQDQWPTAVRAITSDPQLAGELEGAAVQLETFTEMCIGFTPPLARDIEGLRNVLRSGQPIGEVAEDLVYLGANRRPRSPGGRPASTP